MKFRRLLAESLPFFLLALAWACSGAGTGSGNGSSRLDIDTEDQAPRRRTRQAQAAHPSEIPLLTLKGISVPGGDEAEAASPGEAEKGTPEEAEKGAPEEAGKEPEKDDEGKGSEPVLALPPRNLFAFEEDPAVVAERNRQAQEAAEKAQEAAKKAAEERSKHEEEIRRNPPPPQPPAITFQYVGYFGPVDDRIGVFAIPGNPGVFLSKSGETVLDRFKIMDIGYESAEIGFVGFKETKRIPLVGGGK